MVDDTNQKDLDNWDGIVKNYLKAENLTEKTGEFVVEDIRVIVIEDKKRLEIETTIDDVKYIYAPNWTATKFIKEKVTTPKEILGKVLVYEKIKVRNPSTQQMVDGISLIDVK